MYKTFCLLYNVQKMYHFKKMIYNFYGILFSWTYKTTETETMVCKIAVQTKNTARLSWIRTKRKEGEEAICKLLKKKMV